MKTRVLLKQQWYKWIRLFRVLTYSGALGQMQMILHHFQPNSNSSYPKPTHIVFVSATKVNILSSFASHILQERWWDWKRCLSRWKKKRSRWVFRPMRGKKEKEADGSADVDCYFFQTSFPRPEAGLDARRCGSPSHAAAPGLQRLSLAIQGVFCRDLNGKLEM